MTGPVLDPRGTCHLVNCPGKGVHPPHGIGAPTQESYERQMRERKLGDPLADLAFSSMAAGPSSAWGSREDALRRAEPWTRMCGPCDAGMPTSCVCPEGDPRVVISALVAALEHEVRP